MEWASFLYENGPFHSSSGRCRHVYKFIREVKSHDNDSVLKQQISPVADNLVWHNCRVRSSESGNSRMAANIRQYLTITGILLDMSYQHAILVVLLLVSLHTRCESRYLPTRSHDNQLDRLRELLRDVSFGKKERK
uniref:Uncharacterized protein n=1 Tax=Timema poppense TaxID=170557 RepID=A0A7R9D621_TIMPO|nr:unnamed protein product [Timema poppensis]